MVESRRDKFIRLLFVLFFIFIVIFSFFLRYKEFLLDEDKITMPVALVLKQLKGIENPQIIMYKHEDGQHLLVKYEIEINNDYYFRTLDAVELNYAVHELFKDKEDGFWINSHDKFYYFNSNLVQQDRSEQFIGETTATPFKNEKETITVSDYQFSVHDGENIREIHSLSKNDEVWLVVTEFSTKVMTIDTN